MLHTDSAIADEIITTRGYRSMVHPDDLQDLGFSKVQARTAPALAIPLWDVHREQHGWQIRPDSPRLTTDGKVIKYENPKGSRVSLDVHPSVQPLLGNPAVPLWITEGVRKGDALVSHGQCTIALMGGVWGFKGTNEHGGKVMLPAWQHVALNGRLVYVVFDSDLATKPNVQAALDALYRFLRERQARPGLVRWPAAYHQSKIGVDDFFAQGHTLADVLAMVPPIGRLPTTYHPSPNGMTPTARINPDNLLTDTYNARALVRDHGQDLRYCYPSKSWLVWTGTHWQRDTNGTVLRLAKQTVRRLAGQADTLTDDQAVAALLTHVKRSLSTAALKAMVESAQSEEGIPVQPEDLDTDPWLLNCTNGTVDLHTGTLRPHRQADLITKCLPVASDADAQCPTWERFLWRIMGGTITPDKPDMDAGELENRRQADDRATRLITFLQRAIGYSLTGDTREQCLFLLHGSGSNGKSTFLEVLQALLGDYAASTPSASLLAKDRHDGIPNDIARLRGARLVTAVEIGEGKRLNEELVKRLTGQDTLTGRFLFAEFFDFQPEFKLWIACNHLPTIRGTDHAIWRRIRLIPFTVTIPDDEQDKQLPAKLRAELPGILRWAVQGCLDWQREGLGTPQEVSAATKAYRDSMDVLGAFIDECCAVKDYAKIKASALYAAYEQWCKDNAEQPLVQRNFGLQLSERGYERYRNQGAHWWRGIGLPGQDRKDQ